MCLSTVTERIEKPSAKVTLAWKVMEDAYGDARLYFTHMGGLVPRGKWLRAIRSTLGAGLNRYTAGFHAYTTRADALAAAVGFADDVHRVKLRRVHTRGWQGGHRVLVADEMLVPQPKSLRRR